jgi:hypothetical protein
VGSENRHCEVSGSVLVFDHLYIGERFSSTHSFFAKYYGNQIKYGGMYGLYVTHGRGSKCIQNFSRKYLRDEIT